jgi:hypothetical protein
VLLTFPSLAFCFSSILLVLLSGFNNTPKSTNASGSYTDDTPKGATRILNSLQTRQAYQEKKKSGQLGTSTSASRPGKSGSTKPTTPSGLPKILPGERLGEYNRRIEDHLRPEVTGAIKAAAAIKAAQEKEVWMEKKRRREEAKEDKRRKERGEVKPATTTVAGDPTEAKGKRKATIMDDTDDEEDQTTSTTTPKRPRKTEFETLPLRRGITDVVQAPPARLPSLKRLPKQQGGAFSATGRTPLNPGQKRLMEEERERVIKRYREMKEEKMQQREAGK